MAEIRKILAVILVAAATASALSLLILCSPTGTHHEHVQPRMLAAVVSNSSTSPPNGKLLLRVDGGSAAGGVVEAERVGKACSADDIRVTQGPTPPLSNHVPTYTVHVTNACARRCGMSNVHLRCGWFSSTILINPRIFRRLRYNDCLVNDGRTIRYGRTVSFRYANSFPYRPMDVSSFSCTPA